jgi:ferrous iron transport protein B
MQRHIALAGNPNVGKSTVFNTLTGLNQHTGNWPGKTVENAQGHHSRNGDDYVIVDLPGTYSLMPHSAEEEVARDYICFGGADAVIVVCDAVCLERNMNLVLQTLEITPNVVVCVNLMDEAEKKNITVDTDKLSSLLGVPVVGMCARAGIGFDKLMDAVDSVLLASPGAKIFPYLTPIEQSVTQVTNMIKKHAGTAVSPRWAAIQLLTGNTNTIKKINEHFKKNLPEDPNIKLALEYAQDNLKDYNSGRLKDTIVSNLVITAEGICTECVQTSESAAIKRERRIDRFLTGKITGIPVMIFLLCVVFWLTIVGSNYPSQWLSALLLGFQDKLTELFAYMHAPEWLHGMLVLGMYRVLAWVVSVMLPPMAIFFPLFTLLEDLGYLPRIAFNLDYYFKKCRACGKQCLTMCLGFGCNAAGVTGARIIDSPRERLIAIITNSFVPCNGRFPTLISIITMFLIGQMGGVFDSVFATLILACLIVFAVLLTFAVSRWLSSTLLKGEPSSFTLELPPYRRPQIGRVIVRSVFDRTLFVLKRAIAVAAPAGVVIWLFANIHISGSSLLSITSNFLDPFAQLFGLDGVILMAFILGFPANEIVMPIAIMAYMAGGTLTEFDDLFALRGLLVSNGWTWVTAVCTMLFCLVHWPCSTTCLTIKKETGSWKWTLVSMLIPTVIGLALCFIFHSAVTLLGVA